MQKLEIKDLHVSVEDKLILKGINMEINNGEIHALIGPNGQGKSTLLSTIMGHPRYKVEKGEIIYNGINILELSVDERSKTGIFLAMQSPVEINGVTNIDFLKSAINARRDTPINLYTFIREVEKNAKDTGFDLSLTNRFLNEGFSGGEKKRNEILQMKLLRPSLALIDEIDSGLDVDGFSVITSSINSLKSENFSSIIVSHYSKIYEIIKPDFIHVIMDGRIVETGDLSLLEKVNNEGYSWLEKKYKLKNKEQSSKSLGICLAKETKNEK